MVSSRSAPSALVVGAGAAGLSTARCLHEAGVSLRLLEASHAIGGRCLTARLPADDSLVEVGATWFHGTAGNPAYELARSIGVSVPPTHVATLRASRLLLTDDGSEADRRAVDSVWRCFSRAMRLCDEGGEECKGHASVGAVCREAWEASLPGLVEEHGESSLPLLHAAFEWAARMQCSIDGCADLSEQGLQAYANYEELGGKDVMSNASSGGFSSVMEALASDLRADGCIELGRAVSRVEWEGRPTAVLVDGERISADAIVLSVSLAAMRQITFVPPLPRGPPATQTWKATSLASMSISPVEKIFIKCVPTTFDAQDGVPLKLPYRLVLSRMHWPTCLYSLVSDGKQQGQQRTLTAWLTGEGACAVSGRSSTELLPELEQAPAASEGGSPMAVDNHGAELPLVLFCGEATSRAHFGTVHGAMLSGEREAARLLKAWRECGLMND
ncbi:MAG: hypothetical protein SGPRY_002705 [Prymnesium sp.]